VIIFGGDPAGVATALAQAEAGMEVVLVESSPSLGPERLPQPRIINGDPPYLGLDWEAVKRHPNIRLITNADLIKTTAADGRFRFKIRHRAPRVDPEKCNACNACIRVCPIHMYDDFIIANLLQLEMLGFCKRGQGSAFIRETDFSHSGDLPLNTGGGQISAGQAGLAGGGTILIEAVRQLFSEGGARQVRNIRNALVTGIGGISHTRNWHTSTVAVLEPDA
jgi:NAD-dependent dihydropyrimidine dehydrogenase PreA subunit